MRGKPLSPSQRGLSASIFTIANLFLLALLLAGGAIFSGCASVSANNRSLLAAKISVIPSAVEFKEVVVGQKNSQTILVSNFSGGPVRLDEIAISGKGFTLLPEKAPILLAPGTSVRLNVAFTPTTPAAAQGALQISNVTEGVFNVPLSGSGEKASPQMELSPSALNFGAVSVHNASSQSVSLKNTGNVAVTINSIGMPGGVFSVAGLAAGTSLSPGQTLPFRVTYQPNASGTSSSGVTIASTALSAPLKLSLSGSATNSSTTTASQTPPPTSTPTSSAPAPSAPSSAPSTPTAAPTPASVALNWDASTSSVAGYHVYRSSVSGGPYTRITASTVTALNYSDGSVQAGSKYFYVVSALDPSGDESAYSNEASADIPNN
jgi:hypothetical protein